jgi:hypothetical protein
MLKHFLYIYKPIKVVINSSKSKAFKNKNLILLDIEIICLYHLRDIKRLPEGESSMGHTALYTRIVLMLVMDVTDVLLK